MSKKGQYLNSLITNSYCFDQEWQRMRELLEGKSKVTACVLINSLISLTHLLSLRSFVVSSTLLWNANCGELLTITMADCGRQIHTTITMRGNYAWDAPSLGIYTSLRRARGGYGLIFKQHIWLAYSKSADGPEEAVVGHAAVLLLLTATPCLLSPPSPPCHACTWKWWMAHCSLCVGQVGRTCASWAAGGCEAFALQSRPLCCCCCHMIADDWLDIKGGKSLRPSLLLSLVQRLLPLE